jgi:uncharacterized protein (TIGR02611 family)
MERIKHSWRRTPKVVRLPLVFIIGWIVVLAGVIMLVTPGPGWAGIFLGFAILATEFTSAAKVRDWLVKNLELIITWLKYVWDKLKSLRRN